MVVGTTLLLPCFIDGCGFFIGDVHFAQGDGEVAGTAIETGAIVTVKTEIRKGQASLIKQPHFEGGSQIKALEPDRFHATVGYPFKEAGEIPPQWTYLDSEKIKSLSQLSNDITLAARNSLLQMLDWLQATKGLGKEESFVVMSVACDLRIGNVVDVPNYVVSTICPMEIFSLSFGGAHAHTPYGQWDSFRIRHLQVLTSRSDLIGDAVADQWVAVLAEHLPKSKAVVSRARNFVRVASLLKTDQAKVAVLSYDQAASMFEGREKFQDFGPLPLQVLVDNGTYLLVSRADLPENHGLLVVATLLEQAAELNLSVPMDGLLGMEVHSGAKKAVLGE